MNRLAPVSEVPMNNEESSSKNWTSKGQAWRNWLSNHFPQFFHKKSNLKILLSVLGCPLFPVSVNPEHALKTQVSSSPQYIIQHFTAATGCRKMEGVLKNMYATGKVAMAMVDEAAAGPSASVMPQNGCFVIWQMMPDKWLIELVVGGHKVVAGCDGNMAWRHTPWLGAHAARGGVRPLRRALQGLDPVAISLVFSTAHYTGEKRISGVDCFVLKLSAEPSDLADRSDSSAEMIKHVTIGYFSQRCGLLVHLEDSYLTRIHTPGSPPAYWETTTCTRIDDYRAVEGGMMVAHSGHSSVTITRFGGDGPPEVTRMEENYSIDDLAINVPGLSVDSFIPPREIASGLLAI